MLGMGPAVAAGMDDARSIEPVGEIIGYVFGDFELNLRSRRLLLSGVVRHVEKKTFELLRHLVSHRDRVVTKHELNRALWGGRAISEGALSQCVWTARRAIGAKRGLPSLIETVNGVGYRFVGDVVLRREEPLQREPETPLSRPYSEQSPDGYSFVAAALSQLILAQPPAPGTPPEPDPDCLLHAALACRRFADAVLGGLAEHDLDRPRTRRS
jgi:DNA-binding winged helix-turn-helix (wHTH) protein